MRVRSVFSVVILTAGLVLLCHPAQAAALEVRQGSAVSTDIVEYRCATDGVAEKQDIKVKVELVMPTIATTEQQMTIGWHGTYAEGTGLRAPTAGLDGSAKLYAYASISGLSGLTSATGVEALNTVGAGHIIPLPTAEVPLKTTAHDAGTAMVRPGAMNIGDKPTEPFIECDVLNQDELKTYTLTVVAAGQTTSPTPTPATTSPRPTHTVTATVTETPANTNDTSTKTPAKGNNKFAKTPAGAAETGGGGDAGPDGRVFVLTGLLLILSAAAGLLLRRRAVTRG